MASVKIILRNKPNKEGEYPIVLRIVKDRKSKTISLGISCNKKDWDATNNQFKRSYKNYIQRNRVLLKLKEKALKVIDEFRVNESDYNLDEFETAFRGVKKNQELKVVDFFNEIIDEMTRAGRISNANAYEDTRDSLVKFNGKNFKFKDITPTFLEKYEVFLREIGNKNGGIAFKMRELRALFNKARKRKLIPKEPYPFEEYKISRLKPESNKIALTLNEFKKIKEVDLTDQPHLLEAFHYFLFSIYTRGMNFQDMMLLKWGDIQNNRIYYTRSKTKGKINLEIIKPVQEILDYYKVQNRPIQYIFPILLHNDLTPQQIANRKHKVLRRYNQKLKEIAFYVKNQIYFDKEFNYFSNLQNMVLHRQF